MDLYLPYNSSMATRPPRSANDIAYEDLKGLRATLQILKDDG